MTVPKALPTVSPKTEDVVLKSWCSMTIAPRYYIKCSFIKMLVLLSKVNYICFVLILTFLQQSASPNKQVSNQPLIYFIVVHITVNLPSISTLLEGSVE